jgi:hypothetical protein
MRRLSPMTIPGTQAEILAWLEGLLSKQYDTEETALHAVEEYRDAVVAALEAEAARHDNGSDVDGWRASHALRDFAKRLADGGTDGQ